MTEELDLPQGKTLGELGYEALWFIAHTVIAIFAMAVTILAMALFHPDRNSSGPMFLGSLLAFLIPMIVGYGIARRRRNSIARYVWISGLVVFVIACVWVIDLPTGPGLCEHCVSLFERLRRTFFSISDGSGLIAGWGPFIGCWMPLSLFGYATGAKLGLDS